MINLLLLLLLLLLLFHSNSNWFYWQFRDLLCDWLNNTFTFTRSRSRSWQLFIIKVGDPNQYIGSWTANGFKGNGHCPSKGNRINQRPRMANSTKHTKEKKSTIFLIFFLLTKGKKILLMFFFDHLLKEDWISSFLFHFFPLRKTIDFSSHYTQ